MADDLVQIPGVRDETWKQRVNRLFGEGINCPFDPKYTDEQNRQLVIIDAQELAVREMNDEIHLMLRMLLRREK